MDIFSKKYAISVLFVFATLFSVIPAFSATNQLDIKLMTFNVRVPVDPYPYDWPTRKPRVTAGIEHQNPDFFGLQEALPEVVDDINQTLSKYSKIGRGRNPDGGGEFTPIFYKKASWIADKNDQGTLQLSPTPEIVGSNGWQMQFPRIFTWTRFIEQKSGRAIYIFNTHFPLKPEERDLSIKELAKYIAERKNKNDPVVLMGDFNALEHEDAIKYISGDKNSPIAMKDSFRVLHPDLAVNTFHAFGKETEMRKVDYIFTQGDVRVLSADVVQDAPNYASDHYAVVAKIRLAAVK